MNFFKREKGAQWPVYRIVPHHSYGKWTIEKEKDGVWTPFEFPMDLTDAKRLIIHLNQGPIYPPFNTDQV